jgi:hypothetical protein
LAAGFRSCHCCCCCCCCCCRASDQEHRHLVGQHCHCQTHNLPPHIFGVQYLQPLCESHNTSDRMLFHFFFLQAVRSGTQARLEATLLPPVPSLTSIRCGWPLGLPSRWSVRSGAHALCQHQSSSWLTGGWEWFWQGGVGVGGITQPGGMLVVDGPFFRREWSPQVNAFAVPAVGSTHGEY